MWALAFPGYWRVTRRNSVMAPPQCHRQRIPVIGLLGAQLNRPAILLDGVNQVSGGLERVAQRQVQIRVVGAQADSGAEFGHTLIESAGLGERRGQPRVRLGIIGSLGKDLLIFRAGRSHVSRLQQ